MTYLGWVSVHQGWGSLPESDRAGCHTLLSNAVLAQTYTGPPDTIWADASQTHCAWQSVRDNCDTLDDIHVILFLLSNCLYFWYLRVEWFCVIALAKPPEWFPQCLHKCELEVDHHIQNGLWRKHINTYEVGKPSSQSWTLCLLF